MNFKHCEIHHFLLLNFMHNCIIFGSYFKHLKRKQIARFIVVCIIDTSMGFLRKIAYVLLMFLVFMTHTIHSVGGKTRAPLLP